jgi:hypothetical protein
MIAQGAPAIAALRLRVPKWGASSLPQKIPRKRTKTGGGEHFAPMRRSENTALFDHPVGGGKERRWHDESEITRSTCNPAAVDANQPPRAAKISAAGDQIIGPLP